VSGIHTPGVFPAAKLARLIDESDPHVVGESPLAVSCPTVATFSHLAFRVLIRAAARYEEQVVRPVDRSIPSRVFNSCGLIFDCLEDTFMSSPLMTFCAKRSLYTQRLAFSVSISNQPDDLSPDRLPVRDL
jgi:hypothetical protein